MMTIEDVNAMSPRTFIDIFGGVAEHSPWVAREAQSYRPFHNREDMALHFERALKSANIDAQLALILAHPDLATRARLTEESSKEQAGAGLDSLTAEEFARFTTLNGHYRERFGFPFIFAVKGATKNMILDSFAERVTNQPEQEFAMAIAQICRIFRFRIEDRVSP